MTKTRLLSFPSLPFFALLLSAFLTLSGAGFPEGEAALAALTENPSSAKPAGAAVLLPVGNRVSFEMRYRNLASSYRRTPVFLLPGETLALEAGAVSGSGTEADSFDLVFGKEAGSRGSGTDDDGFAEREGAEGKVDRRGAARFELTAPSEPGFHLLDLRRAATGEGMEIALFVLTPASAMKGEYLEGYRIGKYPQKPYKGLDFYRAPKGFFKVTPGNRDLLLTPHFRIGQFLCKQASGRDKFVFLQEELLFRLEEILAEVNSNGYRCSTLQVMSGFRTPFYNKSLGNAVYSVHQFGGAADIFIDSQGKGMMEDLNADGRVDEKDSSLLYSLIEGKGGQEEAPDAHGHGRKPFRGGLGKYRSTASHGPFVHVDVRGFDARWAH